MGRILAPHISNIMENKNTIIESTSQSNTETRDKASAKKRLNKILKIILIAFLSLGLLCGVLALVLKYVFPPVVPFGYDDSYFFTPDYNKNIFEDQRYMSLNRNIFYNDFGYERVINNDNADNLPGSARFLYDYINCIIEGKSDEYASYFSQEYVKNNESLVSKGLTIPIYSTFTMQGLYDIKINTVSREDDTDGDGVFVERYEISYKIFENNGTFRRDILPSEPRTLVYTLYTNKSITKINNITFIQFAQDE